MSGGYNSAFLTAMRGNATQIAYLRNNVFASQPHIVAGVGQQLVNLMAGNSGIEVHTAGNHRSFFSHAFMAHWLPNNPKAAPAITLGTVGADIFFTPALTGCVLEINGTTVTHHDAGSTTRDTAAQLAAGGGIGHRCWHNDAIAPGFYASVVIGVRRNGVWEFYQQSYNPGSGMTTPLPANQVTQI
ncbi:hypothetical protein [Xanthomonas bundabergensis]|uniref:hypothetical protein n=1 Tax=Xanthomonas bundabergensis TaxID=3160842 RepID=UPI0035180743